MKDEKDEKKEKAHEELAAKPVAKQEVAPASAISASSEKVSGVLLSPLVTEKGTRLEAKGIYQFAVASGAEKIQIKHAFFSNYGIHPTKIRIMHRRGKAVRFGRAFGMRKNWKRALITLPKGKTVNVHEGV